MFCFFLPLPSSLSRVIEHNWDEKAYIYYVYYYNIVTYECVSWRLLFFIIGSNFWPITRETRPYNCIRHLCVPKNVDACTCVWPWNKTWHAKYYSKECKLCIWCRMFYWTERILLLTVRPIRLILCTSTRSSAEIKASPNPFDGEKRSRNVQEILANSRKKAEGIKKITRNFHYWDDHTAVR